MEKELNGEVNGNPIYKNVFWIAIFISEDEENRVFVGRFDEHFHNLRNSQSKFLMTDNCEVFL